MFPGVLNKPHATVRFDWSPNDSRDRYRDERSEPVGQRQLLQVRLPRRFGRRRRRWRREGPLLRRAAQRQTERERVADNMQ